MTTEQDYRKIVVVDDNDEMVGYEDMLVARKNNLIRRASRVFVFNVSGKVLVQRRSEHILQPLMLDQSVGGHVDEGETYLDAAVREMEEELGLVNIPLIEIITSYRTKSHFNGIYKAVIPDRQEVPFDPHEVAEVIWFDPDDLTQKMVDSPTEFTDSFPVVWRDLRDKIILS